jgi:serine/threonine protein kinase
MSPEQASGSPVDFRSDQFSLGVILYEMVTAKRAFEKKTSIETLAAIINEEPEPVQSINSHIAAPIRWLIERCIEKNPADRKRKLHKIFDVAAVLAILALGSALFFMTRDRQKVQTEPEYYHRLTYQRGPIESALFSRDGQTIVYSAAWEGETKDLFVSRPGAIESRSLGIQNADVLSISPSGEMLIVVRTQPGQVYGRVGVLSQVNLSGGSPRPIENDVTPMVHSSPYQNTGTANTILNILPGKFYLKLQM